MRWITFFLLLYLAAALDLARFASLSPANHHYPSIQYISMLAIFYALFATEQSAPLAAVVCGITLDILNAETFGIYTLSLGLVAWAITKIRLSIFREHMVSQLIVVLLAVCAIGLLSASFRELSNSIAGNPTASGATGNSSPLGTFTTAPASPKTGLFWLTLTTFTINALYTGLVAPAIFWLLFHFQNLLGFDMKTGRKR